MTESQDALQAGSLLEKTWDRRASVRSAPRRFLEENSKPLFAERMIPILNTSESTYLSQEIRHSITTHHLYRYLNFTVLLESLVVNDILLGIYLKRLGVTAPDKMRLDALRMYTDEAYHTLAAADMAFQIQTHTGIKNSSDGDLNRAFLKRLASLKEGLTTEHQSLIDLVFVIISETLISGNLSDISHDESINIGVKSVIEDHAKDEGRHHLFFQKYLEYLWSTLSSTERELVAVKTPSIIKAFFAPEVESVQSELASYNMNQSRIDALISEAYSQDVINASVKSSAQTTISYFQRLGALDIAAARESFAEEGLL